MQPGDVLEEEPLREDTGEDVHGWGGRAIVALVLSVVVGSVLNKLLDDTTRRVLPSGQVIYTSAGNVGGLVSVLLFFVAVVFAGLAIVHSRGIVFINTAYQFALALLLLWWAIVSLLLRRDTIDRQQAIYILGVMVIAVAVALSPPTLRTVRCVNLLRDVSVLGMLVLSATGSFDSQLPCRSDKCGAFGSLFTGFFYTENSAAIFLIILLPGIMASRSSWRVFLSLTLCYFFVFGTGSRTSLADLAVVSLYTLMYRSGVLKQSQRVGVLWRLLPPVLLVGSAYVFYAYSGLQLTGRGAVYAAIRTELHGAALATGSGPETLNRVFEAGLLGRFQAVGEHGEWPHLLVEVGIGGAVVFACALAALAVDERRWSPSQVVAFGFVLTAALQFVTEPGWTLNARSLSMCALLLTLGMFRRPQAFEGVERSNMRRPVAGSAHGKRQPLARGGSGRRTAKSIFRVGVPFQPRFQSGGNA